jgi:hypothetical protein
MAKRARTKTPLRSTVAKGNKEADHAASVKIHIERGILIKVDDAGWRSLRLLAFERDATLQAFEALNDLLKKYGKASIVVNPLRRPFDSKENAALYCGEPKLSFG